MTGTLPKPLGGEAPPEAPLTRSPLARVLAQARFSSVLKIDSTEAVAPFQERLRRTYPLLEQVQAQRLQFDLSGGAPNLTTSKVWRFSDADQGLVLSLTSDMITLEARRYPGRAVFLERWTEALAEVAEIFAPGLALRSGVRYLNRLSDDALTRLPEWVRDSLIGVAHPELRAHVSQAISEASMKVEEGQLLLRWGILPPNSTIDPSLLEPIPSASWILDIDVFTEAQKPFERDALAEEYQRLSERAYAIFRWVITDAGLEHFGANA